MIEFNLPAKEEDPIASVLETDVYILFNKMQLSGVCVLDEKAVQKDIIAYSDTDIHWGKIIQKLCDLGWDEWSSEDMPGDMIVMKKGPTILHITWKVSGYNKLKAWCSLLNYQGSIVPAEKAQFISDTLYKITVLGYTITKGKHGQPIWHLPPNHPMAGAPGDPSFPFPEPEPEQE